jgi:hypothetical protein
MNDNYRGGPAKPPSTFSTATDAWFWTMRTLISQRHGMRLEQRGFEPDVVIKALDRLYRQRRIRLEHVKALRIWGEAGAVPPALHRDRVEWDEALSRLEQPLRLAGVVA